MYRQKINGDIVVKCSEPGVRPDGSGLVQCDQHSGQRPNANHSSNDTTGHHLRHVHLWQHDVLRKC